MAEVTERDARRNEATAAAAEAAEDHRARRPAAAPRMNVRAADLEPYIGLKYLSRLFKLIAIVLILLFGLGGVYALDFVPGGLKAAYGSTEPHGAMAFVRLKLR